MTECVHRRFNVSGLSTVEKNKKKKTMKKRNATLVTVTHSSHPNGNYKRTVHVNCLFFSFQQNHLDQFHMCVYTSVEIYINISRVVMTL